MADSAPMGLRERRRLQTTAQLTESARRLTAERGLSGFTVPELCAELPVSARTFFNYFACKEDAVLGVPKDREDGDATERFRNGGSPTTAEVSRSLVLDLAALQRERWRCLDLTPQSAVPLRVAIETEPRLLDRLSEVGASQDRADLSLLAAREGLPEGDLRLETAVQMVGAVVRASAVEFFSASAPESFIEVFDRRIDALRVLLTSQTTHS